MNGKQESGDNVKTIAPIIGDYNTKDFGKRTQASFPFFSSPAMQKPENRTA